MDMWFAHSRALTCVMNGNNPVLSICIKQHTCLSKNRIPVAAHFLLCGSQVARP